MPHAASRALPMKRAIALIGFAVVVAAQAAGARVSTLIGTGAGGYSDTQVNNSYGLVVGPDGVLYFCDLDNQRIRRLHLTTTQLTTMAGSCDCCYSGAGSP